MNSTNLFRFAFWLLIFSLSSSIQAQTQFSDSLFYFNQPLELASGGKFILGDSGFGYKLQPQSVMKAVPIAYTQKVAVPRSARVSDKPIILQNQKMCYEFSCADACESCKLIWYDRNGDGKVQPRQELRCINAKGKVGRISVQKVPCR